SSLACYDGQTLHRPQLDLSGDNPAVLPSLLYIDRQQQAMVGTAAAQQYLQHETGRRATWEKRIVGEIDVVSSGASYVQSVHVLVDTGAHGRLLQYIKTALRDPGYDGTQVFDRFHTVDELIAEILRPLKASAEQQLQTECNRVVLGRPVKYSPEEAVSERAQAIMYKAARLAGFETIGFEMEPIGALYFYHRTSPKRELALVFDFGGGTLDLTLAEVGGPTPPNIIATLGALVGGDDLDKRLMQFLFKYFGGVAPKGRRALPPYLLDFLENWQTMPLLSRPHMLKVIDQYRADNPSGVAALLTLVTRNLGFQLFRKIEQAKIRLSTAHLAELKFKHADIHIRETLTRLKFENLIAPEIATVEAGVQQILREANLAPDRVDVVLRTGGTSAVPVFTELLSNLFGHSKLRSLELLTSVVGGLAIAAHEERGSFPEYEVIYPKTPTALFGAIRSDLRGDYEPYEFRIGAQPYLDYPYTLSRIPVDLSALPALRLAQSDKVVESAEFLHFNLSRAARVYVAYDADARHAPDWLSDFEQQPLTIEIDQIGTPRMMNVYAKDFPAGEVALGGNRSIGSAGNVFMHYLVVARPALTR
ncbi:MAG: Hsp70 family protein, partial [Chloroflexi bacterium]|nr:Hsp70 family protein [Chloroflexota bacterium]